MLLRVDRLTENRVASIILLFHGACGLFHVGKCFRLNRRAVRDYRLRRDIDFHQGATARARHFEIGFALAHKQIIPQSDLARRQMQGEDFEEIQHLPAKHHD